LYDPRNPEHQGPIEPSGSSIQSSMITPKKSRLQSIVKGLQDALRVKASYFHVQHTPDLTIPSPSSSASKKSVRFREGHFVIEHEEKPVISQLPNPLQNSSPQLPKLNFSQTPLLPAYSAASCTKEDHSMERSPGILSLIVPRPSTMSEDPFDDIHTTEDPDDRVSPPPMYSKSYHAFLIH
jgi:hypothetical protein